jgi:hypothetical protein
MSSFRAYYDHTDCFQELYNITAATKAAKGNELGIFEDLGDVYAQEDLDLFFAAFAQYASFESLQFQSSNSIIEASPRNWTNAQGNRRRGGAQPNYQCWPRI